MAISKQTIVVKTFGRVYEERVAGEAGIYPGMACKVNSAGKVVKQDTEGAKDECLIALEDRLQGNTVSDVYTNDYPVRLMIFRPGEEFCGLLESGQDISIGEKLIFADNGKFISASDSGSNDAKAVAVAMEALDLSSGSSDALIHMRTL